MLELPHSYFIVDDNSKIGGPFTKYYQARRLADIWAKKKKKGFVEIYEDNKFLEVIQK